MHACLAVTNLPPQCTFDRTDRDLLRATAVTRVWKGYRNESAQMVDPEADNSPAPPAGTVNPQPFNHEPGVLTTELSPLRFAVVNRIEIF